MRALCERRSPDAISFFAFIATILFASLSLAVGTVSAATIEVVLNDPDDVSIISLSGPIVKGDADTFLSKTEGFRKAIVILESPGGKLTEALTLGSEIRLRGFSTSVVEERECFSACALIWLGGNNRYMWTGSRIGFHAAYYQDIDGPKESGMANAEIGSYLTHLGLSKEAIRFATRAGPDELMFLSPKRARIFGIDIVLNEDGKSHSGKERLSGDALAEIFVSVSAWESVCSQRLAPPNNGMLEARARAHSQGNELLGEDQWIELFLRRLEETKYTLEAEGEYLGCLALDNRLFDLGVPGALSGPSFDCSKAVTPTETTICSYSPVWADDVLMNQIYLLYRDSPKSQVRSDYFAAQRAWLTLRDTCKNDLRCLEEIYLFRIRTLIRDLDLN